jgi:hypothetical protein
MTQPFWETSENVGTEIVGTPWDYVILGGYQLPGVLEEPPKAEASRKVDKKNGPGLDGATLTWQGYDPPEVTMKILLWKPEHWEQWQDLLGFILPRPGKPPAQPFRIDHPALSALGITEVAITKVSAPERASARGVMRITIQAQQWVKPKKVGTTTPKAAAGGVPATVHDQKGGYTPAAVGPPAPPQPPSKFNTPTPE